MVARFLQALTEFFFPSVCWVCDADTEGDKLCSDCRNSIQTIERNFCQMCGQPLEKSRRKGVCKECVKHPLALTRIRAWARFTYPLDKLVYAFKYQRRMSLADYFSRQLVSVVNSDPFLKKADAVVPIPLFPLKHWWRGYNQSGLLARSLTRRLNITVLPVLYRPKMTRTQTRLSAEQRRANVRDAFAIRPSFNLPAIQDKNLILLDDVITTGATLDAAAEVLLDAGATEVYGLTIGGAWIGRD